MKTVLFSGTLKGVSVGYDGSPMVTINSQELPRFKRAQLGELMGQFCYFAIKEEAFEGEEVSVLDEVKAPKPKTKSASQQLRHRIFRLWEKEEKDKNEMSFDEFYAAWMRYFMQTIENKLDGAT